jgi:hypothetical protein
MDILVGSAVVLIACGAAALIQTWWRKKRGL